MVKNKYQIQALITSGKQSHTADELHQLVNKTPKGKELVELCMEVEEVVWNDALRGSFEVGAKVRQFTCPQCNGKYKKIIAHGAGYTNPYTHSKIVWGIGAGLSRENRGKLKNQTRQVSISTVIL
jgi:hypothetical protein